MTSVAANLAAFDMAMSIPAEDLHACVDHGLNAISKLCPEAVLPSAQWVLSARAQELGIAPKGQCSANGTCRLLSCLDGWLGVNLPRHSDWELLNPWLATDEPLSNWSMLTTAVASRNGLALAARGREMGLPLAFVAANPSAEFPVDFPDSARTRRPHPRKDGCWAQRTAMWRRRAAANPPLALAAQKASADGPQRRAAWVASPAHEQQQRAHVDGRPKEVRRHVQQDPL